jgi:hypothetical protein
MRKLFHTKGLGGKRQGGTGWNCRRYATSAPVSGNQTLESLDVLMSPHGDISAMMRLKDRSNGGIVKVCFWAK